MPKISALPIANSAATGDLLVLDQGNLTKRIDFNVLQSAIANAGTVQSLILQNLQSGIAQPVSGTNVNFLQAGAGAITRTIQDKNRDTVSIFDYMTPAQVADVKARTTLIDVTSSIQSALTFAAANGLIVKGAGLALISGPLTYSPVNGGGIDWDDISAGGAGLKISGSGYTAFTVTAGTFSVFNLAVMGTGNTANGIEFDNPQLSTINNAIAFSLDGFGVQVNQAYDCFVGVISANLCGNATNYAVSVNDGANTTNHSHFCRLQSEQANKRALSISPNTFSCVFDSIHSERLIPDAAQTAWLLGGVSCTYNTVRLNSSGISANANCLLEGTLTTFVCVRAEGNIPVQVEADGGTSLTLVEPTISGSLAEFVGQIGKIRIYGGSVNSLSGATPNILFYGTKIGAIVQDAISVTPVLRFGGASSNIAYTFQTGWARVIGDMCDGSFTIFLSNMGSVTGTATIKGLPFNNKNQAGQFAPLHLGYNAGLSFSGTPVIYLSPGDSTITISQISAGIETLLSSGNFSNTTFLMGNFKYQLQR